MEMYDSSPRNNYYTVVDSNGYDSLFLQVILAKYIMVY